MSVHQIPQQPELKVPPHSFEAEQSVLGGIFADNSTLDIVSQIIRTESFYSESHKTIYEGILELRKQGKPIDGTTFVAWAKSNAVLENFGGVPYLAQMINATPTVSNIKDYADIVFEEAKKREMIKCVREMSDIAWGIGGDKEILAGLQSRFMLLENQIKSREHAISKTNAEVFKETLEALDFLSESKTGLVGFDTGYKEINRRTAGFSAGDLIILAGRPAMGKTAFALNLARNIAKQNFTTVIFSLEMPNSQLQLRLLSDVCNIPLNRLRTGQLSKDEWGKLSSDGVKFTQEQKIIFNDGSGKSLQNIVTECGRIKRKHGLDFIVIDYLQLMDFQQKNNNLSDAIGEITKGLKNMAKNFKVPVLVLSQLSRAVEQRHDKRPMLSDLRSSGSIEQDADIIIFAFRPSYYLPDNHKDKNNKTAWMNLEKIRNGEAGNVYLEFEGKYCRFSEPSNFGGSYAN